MLPGLSEDEARATRMREMPNITDRKVEAGDQAGHPQRCLQRQQALHKHSRAHHDAAPGASSAAAGEGGNRMRQELSPRGLVFVVLILAAAMLIFAGRERHC